MQRHPAGASPSKSASAPAKWWHGVWQKALAVVTLAISVVAITWAPGATPFAWALFACFFLDVLDGFVSATFEADSPAAVQWRGLSSMVAFGALPAVFLLRSGDGGSLLGSAVSAISALVFVVATAHRLAQFNVAPYVLNGRAFRGLPVPMAAGFVVFCGWCIEPLRESAPTGIGLLAVQLWPVAAVWIVVGLMRSSLPYPRLSRLASRTDPGRSRVGWWCAGAALILLGVIFPRVFAMTFVTAYLSSGPLVRRQVKLELARFKARMGKAAQPTSRPATGQVGPIVE